MDLNMLKQLHIMRLCFAISYVSSGMIIAVTQGILYFSLRYISKYFYRKINYYLNYSFFCQLIFMFEWWAGSTVKIYIDKEEFEKYYGKEHAYLIMNHSYEIDWLIGWKFCDGIGVLGNCKAYAKKSLQYMPPIGWIWKFAEFVFLQRSFEKDRTTILNQVSELGDYPDPIWLLLFPEGTRFTPKKHEASQKFAQEKGLPLLKYHLTPRTKGFTTSLQGMNGKFHGLYDIQIAFDKSDTVSPTMTSLLYGHPVKAHLYIKRIALDSLPKDEEECAKWLHDLYQIKDKMQESFNNTGDFFKESGVERVAPFEMKRRPYSLINTVFWNVVILVPALRWLFGLLLSGELLYFGIGCSVLAAFYFALQYLIGMSKVSKASSYGAEKKEK